MKVYKMFDIMFAASEKFYNKFKDSDAKTMGWLIVSLFQFLIVLNIFSTYSVLAEIPFKDIFNKTYAVAIMVTMGIVNFIRYTNKQRHEQIVADWEKRTKKSKVIIGIVTFMLILILIGLPIIFGIIENQN